MPENKDAIEGGAAAGSNQPASVATEISFCPLLNLYHYKRADGTDYLFDGPQLEKSIDAFMKTGNARHADFMASLTSFARIYPHQVVSFDEKGQLRLRDLEAALPPGGDLVDGGDADKP